MTKQQWQDVACPKAVAGQHKPLLKSSVNKINSTISILQHTSRIQPWNPAAAPELQAAEAPQHHPWGHETWSRTKASSPLTVGMQGAPWDLPENTWWWTHSDLGGTDLIPPSRLSELFHAETTVHTHTESRTSSRDTSSWATSQGTESWRQKQGCRVIEVTTGTIHSRYRIFTMLERVSFSQWITRNSCPRDPTLPLPRLNSATQRTDFFRYPQQGYRQTSAPPPVISKHTPPARPCAFCGCAHINPSVTE